MKRKLVRNLLTLRWLLLAGASLKGAVFCASIPSRWDGLKDVADEASS